MLADPGFAAANAAADPVGFHVTPIVRTMKRDSLTMDAETGRVLGAVGAGCSLLPGDLA
jgi:hypothetical protein